MKDRFCDLSYVNSFSIIVNHYMMKFIINIDLIALWSPDNLDFGRGSDIQGGGNIA